jgi:hypothetical protein
MLIPRVLAVYTSVSFSLRMRWEWMSLTVFLEATVAFFWTRKSAATAIRASSDAKRLV